jgi:hypothetical protein
MALTQEPAQEGHGGAQRWAGSPQLTVCAPVTAAVETVEMRSHSREETREKTTLLSVCNHRQKTGSSHALLTHLHFSPNIAIVFQKQMSFVVLNPQLRLSVIFLFYLLNNSKACCGESLELRL